MLISNFYAYLLTINLITQYELGIDLLLMQLFKSVSFLKRTKTSTTNPLYAVTHMFVWMQVWSFQQTLYIIDT